MKKRIQILTFLTLAGFLACLVGLRAATREQQKPAAESEAPAIHPPVLDVYTREHDGPWNLYIDPPQDHTEPEEPTPTATAAADLILTAAPPKAAEATEPAPAAPVYLGNYWVCGYDACADCCGKTDGITASGAVATVGRTVAANFLPFGTVIYIDGIGERVVEDTGNMNEGVIDLFCSDHAECYTITGQYDVYIVWQPEGTA